MTIVAKVNLWDKQVGAVAWDVVREYATFEFDQDFIQKGLDPSPIKMPIEEARNKKAIFSFPSLKETFKGLPGWLADSLPDAFGNKLIEAWLARQGRDANSMNPVERLCYIGKRGMGALEYEPILSPGKETSAIVEIDELVKLVNEVLGERKNLKTIIPGASEKEFMKMIRMGISAGGARAKAIIAYNPKTGKVRSGQIDGLKDFEYWLIKFDGVKNKELREPQGYGRIEYAYYLMATAAGIQMMESKLLEEHGRAHFMTRRFDRRGVNKLHMQTLCGLAHFDYNDPGAYSYEQAFQIMRQIKLPYSDMQELFRRMVFNVIARNQDDHTKNISFLMDEMGTWSLSPAYDVSYAYDPVNKWLKEHQMTINGKSKEIQRSDIIQLAQRMNIKKPDAIIGHVKKIVLMWPEYAEKAGVGNVMIKAINKEIVHGF